MQKFNLVQRPRWRLQNNNCCPFFFVFQLNQWRACRPRDEDAGLKKFHPAGELLRLLLFSENLLSLFAVDSWSVVGKYAPSGFHVSLLAEIYSNASSQLSRATGEPFLRGILHFRKTFTHFLGVTPRKNTEVLRKNVVIWWINFRSLGEKLKTDHGDSLFFNSG